MTKLEEAVLYLLEKEIWRRDDFNLWGLKREVEEEIRKKETAE